MTAASCRFVIGAVAFFKSTSSTLWWVFADWATVPAARSTSSPRNSNCCAGAGDQEAARGGWCSLSRSPAAVHRPMIVGLLLVLCNSVMHEGNWSQRGLLFEAFSGCKWPAGVTVRKRLEEVLDGLNLRDDHWRFN